MSKKMCRQYHILTDQEEFNADAPLKAQKELKERLKYEYVFDIITLEDILYMSTYNTWLHSPMREPGHNKRMMKLLSIMGTCV